MSDNYAYRQTDGYTQVENIDIQTDMFIQGLTGIHEDEQVHKLSGTQTVKQKNRHKGTQVDRH